MWTKCASRYSSIYMLICSSYTRSRPSASGPEHLPKVPTAACVSCCLACACVSIRDFFCVHKLHKVQKAQIEMTHGQTDRAEIGSVKPEVAICCFASPRSSSQKINCLAGSAQLQNWQMSTPNSICGLWLIYGGWSSLQKRHGKSKSINIWSALKDFGWGR